LPAKTVVLRNCKLIDPRDITTYLSRDGFSALEKVQKTMTPEQVIDEVKRSRLLGRGGAGFSCGLKWEMAKRATSDKKYVICNADEGEMGTFKDRYILQNDPFTLIEGLAIAAYGIGADTAYIYLRAEYRYLLSQLLDAIEQAKAKGFLDRLQIHVRLGAGAYMCGEETALMNSLEGQRGEARYKPPFPTDQGLWGQPTVVQNVETLMNIPAIILQGAQWFSSIGTELSKGTKVFSVSGDVDAPGVYELELGSPLSELVVELAHARNVKMIQVGGAAGRMVPASKLHSPLSFETVLGAGAVTVYDDRRDVIDVARRTMEFLADESCGKCSPCREGTDAMVLILERLASGRGTDGDIEALEDLSATMTSSSLCGLGQTAPTVVMDTLTHFRKDYENRVAQSVYLRTLWGNRR
jgi:NADH-quinone oxidoreductase subunit F